MNYGRTESYRVATQVILPVAQQDVNVGKEPNLVDLDRMAKDGDAKPVEAVNAHQSSAQQQPKMEKSRGRGRKPHTLENLKKEVEMDEHHIPLSELYRRLGTDPELGLTDEQAREILIRDGPNALTPPKKVPEW
ncbi:sodium/potassium-transporting ATPase subunit alpha-1, partial [Trichinella spiralis]